MSVTFHCFSNNESLTWNRKQLWFHRFFFFFLNFWFHGFCLHRKGSLCRAKSLTLCHYIRAWNPPQTPAICIVARPTVIRKTPKTVASFFCHVYFLLSLLDHLSSSCSLWCHILSRFPVNTLSRCGCQCQKSKTTSSFVPLNGDQPWIDM